MVKPKLRANYSIASTVHMCLLSLPAHLARRAEGSYQHVFHVKEQKLQVLSFYGNFINLLGWLLWSSVRENQNTGNVLKSELQIQ